MATDATLTEDSEINLKASVPGTHASVVQLATDALADRWHLDLAQEAASSFHTSAGTQHFRCRGCEPQGHGGLTWGLVHVRRSGFAVLR